MSQNITPNLITTLRELGQLNRLLCCLIWRDCQQWGHKVPNTAVWSSKWYPGWINTSKEKACALVLYDHAVCWSKLSNREVSRSWFLLKMKLWGASALEASLHILNIPTFCALESRCFPSLGMKLGIFPFELEKMYLFQFCPFFKSLHYAIIFDLVCVVPLCTSVLFLFSFFQEALWLLLCSLQSLRSVSLVRITGHQDSSNWPKNIIIYYLYLT